MMGQTPTDLLREEHSRVLRDLDALERVIARPDKKPETIAELKGLVAFFQNDFWVHFTKEEEALFPELEKFMPLDYGPLGVMLAEHVDLRSINTEFQKAAQAYLSDSDGTGSHRLMKQHGLHFIQVLQSHIDKEDNVLFPMAEMHLEAEQNENVVRLFQEIEAKQVPATKGA